jgi:predicted alpha-1,2-mannosidase
MRKISFVLILIWAAIACHQKPTVRVASPDTMNSSWVNPFIGTGGHGHTYPGATAPFGMVQLSPDTRLEGWDGCGGYHYDDHEIYGFSHTHLQGTGVPDYCDILFMPTNHDLKRKGDHWNEVYKSSFRHETEQAFPGYYKVELDDYHIQARLTTTPRVGIHEYTFAKGDSCRLFLDMMHRDDLRIYDLQTHGDTAISGYRISRGWAKEQHCYFYAVFSQPFHDLTQLDVSYSEQDSVTGQKRTVFEQVQVFSLAFHTSEKLIIKVGLSGVDMDGARNNLYAEAQHWNFDTYVAEALHQWDTKLNKLPLQKVNPTGEERANYYTALYHCYTVPNIWSDVDHRYRGEDNRIHTAVGYDRYTVFSLWDTFRAYHPLMSQIEPEITRDWIVTFLEIYKERGELPVWELAGNETYCMIGYHSVPVIWDAYTRGITNFDLNLALEAMVASATGPQEEKAAYDSLGYVPADQFSESVSKTLEFAYDDWCIAQMAKALNRMDIHDRFLRRSQSWKNLFDPSTGCMRPRRNGGFPEPFDPYQVDFNFTEANAFQYALFVPHDLSTLIQYHGGNSAFEQWLDRLFTASSKTTGREQSDITGLIGQYAHGNEPSHHMAFLYQVIGKPEKTDQLVQRICKELYHNAPDGLCGNEDCGQMSAWYILAMNGNYPICPGQAKEITDFRPDAPSTRISPIPIIQGPSLPFIDTSSFTVHTIPQEGPYLVRWTTSSGEMNEFILEPNATKLHVKMKEATTVEVFEGKQANHRLTTATYLKRSNEMNIVRLTRYNNQYTGGGDAALIDGIRGSADFRTGSWQAWQGTDVEVIVDLGSVKPITTVGISCLQETKSWIWYPSACEVYFSQDGEQFGKGPHIEVEQTPKNETPSHREFTTNTRAAARYVKFVMHPAFSVIPSWHLGSGGTPWIFADEVIIR